jgi:alcohol dehydrogenase (cytochrome c)
MVLYDKPKSRRWRASLLALTPGLAAILLFGPFASSRASTESDFTKAQANTGQQVYSSACASCHGSNLEGQAGPALAGSKFESSLQFSKMSAKQLFDFLSTQMPADNPGSLSHDKYAAVMAYILSKNGYPAGSKKLSDETLGQIQLLPFPNKQASEADQH